MNNVKRILTIMTLAIAAVFMMTAVSFAATLHVTVDGESVTVQEGAFQNGTIEYAILEGSPKTATVTKDDANEFYPYNSYTNSTRSITAGILNAPTYVIDWKNIPYFSNDPNKLLEGLNLGPSDKVVCFMYYDSSWMSRIFLIIIKPLPLVVNSYNIDDVKVDPAMLEDGDDKVAYIRTKTLTKFMIDLSEGTSAYDFNDELGGKYQGGKVQLSKGSLDSNYKIGEDDKDALKAKIAALGEPASYSDYRDYYWVRFTDGVDNYPVLIDAGIDPPAATIKSVECDGYGAVITFEGKDLDIAENGFKTDWLSLSLKDKAGEEYQINDITVEEVKEDSVSLSYSVPDTLEPVAKDAVLTTSFLGQDPVTTDLTIPSTKFWSRYVDPATSAPEKIAKNDKEWPEYAGYYKITSPVELAWFAGLVNGELEGVDQDSKAMAFLANDIELNDTENWKDWDADTNRVRVWDCTIGKAETTNDEGRKESLFEGVFDGNGHVIRGLYIIPDTNVENCDSIMDMALFPRLSVAEIRNLGVEKSFVFNDCRYNSSKVGGIVSNADQSVIENCWFSGAVRAGEDSDNAFAGGIVANADKKTTIRGCFNAGTVNAFEGEASGILANGAGKVESCYNVGEVDGAQIAGDKAIVTACYGAGDTYLADEQAVITRSFYIEGAEGHAAATMYTEEEFRDGTLLAALKSDLFCADYEGEAAINSGYPVLVWQTSLYKAKQAARKEVLHAVDPSEYVLSKAELNKIIEDAIKAIDEAADEKAVTLAKNTAIAAMGELKKSTDIISADEALFSQLGKELAALMAKLEMQGATVTLDKTAVAANGEEQKPVVTVTGADGRILEEGKDYETAFENNIKPGTATVTVTGKGDASSEVKTASFVILPKKAELTKVKSLKKKCLTVTWRQDADVTGYEVQYSLKKNFKGAAKVTVKKSSVKSTVIKKLTSKKRYYVRVRSFKTEGTTKLIGAWSTAKSAKVK